MTKKKPAKRRAQRAASSASTTSTHSHSPRLGPRRSTPAEPSTLPHCSTPAEPSTLPRLLTVDEVADLLRTTRKAVYGLVYRGALPGIVRLGRRLLVDQAALLQWLGERRGVSLSAQGEQR